MAETPTNTLLRANESAAPCVANDKCVVLLFGTFLSTLPCLIAT